MTFVLQGTETTLRMVNGTYPLDYPDPYLDLIWTPIVGATAISTLRIAVHICRFDGGRSEIELAALAQAVGCKPSRLQHAIGRLHRKRLLFRHTGDRIDLYSGVPLAPDHAIARLHPRAIEYASNRKAVRHRP